MAPILLALAGLYLCIVFILGVALPLKIGVVALSGATIWGLLTLRPTVLSVLPRLMILLYSLPFSVLLVYLVDDDYVWWAFPAAIGHIEDRLLMSQMVTIGLVGLIGLICGMSSGRLLGCRWFGRVSTAPLSLARARSLDIPGFLIWLGTALFFAWLFAPTATVLTAAYAASGTAGVAEEINFNASWMVAYIALILLYLDIERDHIAGRRARAKQWLILIGVIYVVLYLQIARGDRESIGVIAALVALYLTGPTIPREQRRIIWRRIRRVIVPVSAVVLLFVLIGGARSELHEMGFASFDALKALQGGLEQNTWTAVLLTNLGIAAQYRHAPMEYLWGETYIDYILSLPPGVVTHALGLERPLEATRGPAWWFPGLSAGGVHVIVVPFKNFGILGVFAILTFFGALIARLELANRPTNFWSRLLYGSVVCSSFFWFWYGDMNLIRALMIASLLGFAYLAWLSVLAVLAGRVGLRASPDQLLPLGLGEAESKP